MYSFLLLINLLLNTFLIYLIVLRNSSTLNYKINSPIIISLCGIFLFYVFPLYYWLINEWPFTQPSYYENYINVQLGITLFLIPLFLLPLRVILKIPNNYLYISNATSILALILSILVLSNSFYETFILGNQGRFEFETYAADSGTYFFTNILKDYGLSFIFLLTLSKNKFFVKIAYLILILDFITTIFSFHRFAILIFIFQVFIFFILMNKIRIKPIKLFIYLFFSLILIVGVIGRFGIEAINYYAISGINNNKSINFNDILQITKNMFLNFNVQTGPSLWDEIFLRINQSRSASAVIGSYSISHQFLYGSTFFSILFIFIPRFIYPNKPDMADVHAITKDFMGGDFGGVNPLGTLSECFINFGYIGIILLSTFFLFFIYYIINILNKKNSTYFLVFYPYFAFMMFAFDLNLSQRVVQISKMLIVYFIFHILILITEKLFTKIDNKISSY